MMIKTFLMSQKISISDKCCSSQLSIHQRNLKNFNQPFSTCFFLFSFKPRFESMISGYIRKTFIRHVNLLCVAH